MSTLRATAASIVTLALSVAAGAQASPATWCERYASERANAPDAQALQRVAESMDETQLANRRALLVAVSGEEAGDAAWASLHLLAELGCDEQAALSPDDARARAEGILSGPEFYGEREEPDLIDKWLAMAQAWFLSFLESEGMRQYAGASRVIYLGALALSVLYLVVRVLRERRRRVARRTADEEGYAVERAREAAASELVALAEDALGHAAPRESMRLAQRAVLARVGEQTGSRLNPARTNREVLRDLPPSVREVVRPALSSFDRTFFSGHADLEVARRFVDEAKTTLHRLSEAA